MDGIRGKLHNDTVNEKQMVYEVNGRIKDLKVKKLKRQKGKLLRITDQNKKKY